MPITRSGAPRFALISLADFHANDRFEPHFEPSSLIVADACADDLADLLRGAAYPCVHIDEGDDVLLAITAALAGEEIDVLHLVAHGEAGRLYFGGKCLDLAAIERCAALVQTWRVRQVVLWSCEAGRDRQLIDRLAELTCASVAAASGPLGMVDGTSRWTLDVQAGELPVPALPFDPARALTWPHRLANFRFTNAYAVNTATTPASKEANSLDFTPISLNVARIDDKSNGNNFSGNDVVVELVVNGQTYYGWISRPIKAGGVVRGFYFWSDPQFGSLSAATTDGNSDGDGSAADNFGFILVVDQAWFDAQSSFSSGGTTLKNVGSSSDRVDSSLNSVMPVNSAPVAVNDAITFQEDGGAQTGNVLNNDTDTNADTLSVTSYSISGVSGTFTLGVAKTITNVGSFTLNADGSYSFTPVANYAGNVPLVTYTTSDGKGGSASASLAITVAQVNDAPSGADKTITAGENASYTFSAADFGFTDTVDNPANTLASVIITTVPNAAKGTLTLNGVTVTAGTEVTAANITKLKFVPVQDGSGSAFANFTFQVRDSGSGNNLDLSPNTITFNVTDVNSRPTAVADTATATEAYGVTNQTAGTNPSGNILTNDTDPDAGDTKTVVSASSTATATTTVASGTSITGAYGTLTLSSDGSYTYTVANSNSTVEALRTSSNTLSDVFTYTMRDTAGLTSVSTLSVTITGNNDTPVTRNDFAFAVSASTAGPRVNPTGNVKTNDSDVDAGDAMTVTRASTGTTLSGTPTTIGAGSVASGDEARVYTQFNTQGQGNIKSGDAVSGTGVPAGTTVTAVSAAGGGARTVTLSNAVVATLGGSITIAGSGTPVDALGTPVANALAISNAVGTVTTGMAVTGGGIVNGTTVSAVSTSNGYSFITLSQNISGTLGTDVQFGSAGTSITGTYGTLVLQQDGTYTYTVTNNSANNVTDNFTYEVTDTAGATKTAVLAVSIVNGSVTPPTAAADTLAITENATSIAGNVLTNDTQSSGTKTVSYAWSAMDSTMTAVTSSGVTLTGLYGSLVIKSDGTATYTIDNANATVNGLAANQALSESFQYRMGDASVGYAVANITVNITGANDAPTANADTATASEAGGTANGTAGRDPTGNVRTNDRDVDSGDSFTVTHAGTTSASTAVSGSLSVTGSYGTLVIAADGSYTYTVANANTTVQALNTASAPLTDTFNYKITDTQGGNATSTLTVSVYGANDAPVNTLPGSSPTIAESASGAISGISVADVDNTTLTVKLGVINGVITLGTTSGLPVSGNGSGSITISGTTANLNTALASLSYQGNTDFSGTDTLTVETTDGGALQDIDTLDISVTPDNRSLTVSGQTVNEASPYAIFTVNGAVGQKVTLALSATGVGSGHATSGGDYVNAMEVYNGSSWVAYDGNPATVPTGGKLLVRVAVLNDGIDEGSETFRLTATNKYGSSAANTSTIVDDGSGLIYDGSLDGTGAPVSSSSGLDDDRALSVNDISVNEGSGYAVFRVSGTTGQSATLALTNGTATDADHGTTIQYWDGAAWQTYGSAVTIPAGGLLVRVSVTNDTTYEGPETFGLVATNLSGRSFVGTATLLDDGTGTKYDGNVTGGNPDTSTSGLDSDLAVSVDAYGPVNEGSTYAMFKVTGTVGEILTLALAGNGATQATTSGFTLQFSTNGGTSWTTYDAATQPVIPGDGIVWVRANISSEQDATPEGSEGFKLSATITTGTGKSAEAATTIVDNGTGTKYDGTLTTGAPTTSTSSLDLDSTDTTPPTIAITSDKAALKAGETATLTFTISESVADFVAGDISVSGGTLSNFTGSGATYTATFTPAASSTTNGVISVASGKFTDAAGNANTDGADADNTLTMSVDTIVPTIAISSDKTALKAGETATLTFTLSESSSDFVVGDITVSGGTLSNFTGSGTSYSATFTPDTASTANGVVSVASGKFTDAAGNANADGNDTNNTVTMTVDTALPTIAISSNKTALKAGETATLTFTISESVADFVAGDITVTGGTLSNFTGSGTSYSATFTPDAGSTANGVVSVASAKFTDAAGNANADGNDTNNTVTMTVDTALPTIAISSDKTALKAGETATLTFTLSESSSDFAAGDVTVSGGTLSNFTGSGTSYSATFTPDTDSTANGVVSVASSKFTDAAGNANADGNDTNNSVTMTVDTARPAIAITSDKASLAAGETATITFTLSESVSDFAAGDVTVSGGALSNFSGSGTSYTATFTPTNGSTANGVISVGDNAFTDAAGNANNDGNDANNAVTIGVGTVLPTIAISSDKTALKAGETATISFTLSESSTDFVAGDVTVSGGTLSNFSGSGTSYSATFTPSAGSTANGVVSVGNGKFTNGAGNANADGGDANNTVSMTVDTARPAIAITSDKASLAAGETATITFTLSESASDFSASDVTVSGGALSNFTGSGSSYTATFTPTNGSTANGVISVGDNAFTDAAGNANADGADTNNTLTISVGTVLPTIAVSSDKTALKAGETATISFTLSESSSDFVAGDVTVSGGTLSNFSGSGSSYSATFTPSANSTASGVVSVASGKFTNASGNANADGSDTNNSTTMTVDTARPSIAITSNKSSLAAGETATITFTLSESSSDFGAGDVTVSGGTLSNFTGSGASYTATFTPTVGSSANGVISVGDSAFTDAAGNANADGADANNAVTIGVGTVLPTIAVSSDKTALKAGETATISFTLSESSSDFVAGDVTVSGGTLSNFTGSGTSYSATFTPSPNSTASGVVSVASGKFTNASGNANADGADNNNAASMTVDTVRPTIAVSADRSNLAAGQSATLQLTLSEASNDFSAADVSVSGGTLSNFSGSGTSYSATFTAAAGSGTSGSVRVGSGAFSDGAGNSNTDGADADNGIDFTITQQRPTIAVSADKTQLKLGASASLSFILSEAATDFGIGDIAVSGGTLSNFSGSGTQYSATFTPAAGFSGQGSVSVGSGAFTGLGGTNADGADADNRVEFSIDASAPTIAVSADKASLGANESATLSFTLSEAVSDFGANDIAVSGGTLSNFSGSGTSYRAVFTLGAGTAGGSVSVGSGRFSDAAGNTNTDGADADNSVFWARKLPPTIAVSAGKTTLLAGELTTLTFSLSSAATDFSADDIQVSGGRLFGFTGSGSTYTAQFAIAQGSTTGATVSVGNGAFTVGGLANADGADANNSVQFTLQRAALPAPAVTIIEDANNDGRLVPAELEGDVDVQIGLPAEALAGDVLQVSDGNGVRTFTLSAADIAAGRIMLSYPAPAVDATLVVSAALADPSGRQGAAASDSVTRVQPVANVAITGISGDTGVDGDFLTADNTLVFSGTATPGASVALALNGSPMGSVQVDAQGNWQWDHSGTSLAAGNYMLTANARSAEGATAATSQLVRILSADLNPATDDGPSAEDHVTSVTNPEFTLKTGANVIAVGDSARLVDAEGNAVGTVAVTPEDVAKGSVNVPTAQLDDGVYVFYMQVLDADGGVKIAVPVTVTIVTDRDGVMPSVELAANGGDFNKDGIADWQQNNVAQLPMRSLADYQAGKNAPASSFGAIMAGDVNSQQPGSNVALDNGAQLLNIGVQDIPAPLPSNVEAKTPMLAFAVTGAVGATLDDIDPARPGLQTRVVIDLPSGVQANTYLKWNATTGSWVDFLDDGNLATMDDGATLLDTDGDGQVDRVVVTLTDGGPGDEDGLENGVIVDPGTLALRSVPVYSVVLASGDRYYSTDPLEAARMAKGTGNVLEGASFDSLVTGGHQMSANFQPFTLDWLFAGPKQDMPYACYESRSGAGFQAADAGKGPGIDFHLYLNAQGKTVFATAAQAASEGLGKLGYSDMGAWFNTTTNGAFRFDAEGYLVKNKDNAAVQALVRDLAAHFQKTSDAGFIEAVEQHYLTQAALVGLPPGSAASAADLNAVFGTHFAA